MFNAPKDGGTHWMVGNLKIITQIGSWKRSQMNLELNKNITIVINVHSVPAGDILDLNFSLSL